MPTDLPLLEKTRSIDPPDYRYESLGKSQIRLLKVLPGKNDDSLRCEIIHTSLQNPQKYYAVSYAWGNNAQDQSVMIKRNRNLWSKLLVTPNLLAALLRLRDPTRTRYLWVDQVCIAQENKSEKNEQVQLMAEIYTRAEKTVVWLGDDDADTPLIGELCNKIVPWPSGFNDISKMHLEDQLAVKSLIDVDMWGSSPETHRRDAVIRFLGRAWFRRAWVYQEVIVAVDVEVYCGEFFVPFEILARMVLAVYYLTKTERDGIWCEKMKKSKGFGPLRAIWYDRGIYHKCDPTDPLDFLHILWRARKYLGATVPGDMVYSFLAFDDCSSGHKIQVDYEISPQETYTRLACSMIKSRKSLDILQCVVTTTSQQQMLIVNSMTDGTANAKTPHLPSWVPDWSNRRFFGGAPILCPGIFHDFDACRGKSHTWIDGDPQNSNILFVKGHIIDSIYTIIPHDCSDNTYFKSSLRQVLKLDDLISLLRDELPHSAKELDGIDLRRSDPTSTPKPRSRQQLNPNLHPRRKYDDIPATALRTLLADGSFSRHQPIESQPSPTDHPIPYTPAALLRVYYNEGNRLFSPLDPADAVLHRYLRDKASIAKGKRPFLTHHLDLGLGYAGFRKGDLVVVLEGSKAPCVLRRKSHAGDRRLYRFMGQVYLDGWMFGLNPRGLKWWEKEARTFALV